VLEGIVEEYMKGKVMGEDKCHFVRRFQGFNFSSHKGSMKVKEMLERLEAGAAGFRFC
jgi:hypothetical protein